MNSHGRRVARRAAKRNWARTFFSDRNWVTVPDPNAERCAADLTPRLNISWLMPESSPIEEIRAAIARFPELVNHRRIIGLDASFREAIDRASGFVASEVRDGFGDYAANMDANYASGGIYELTSEAARLGISFTILAPNPRFGIVDAFEERYQRGASAREREILLGHSPREQEAMAARLRPIDPYPAEQRVGAEMKARTKGIDVEALLREFEPEL